MPAQDEVTQNTSLWHRMTPMQVARELQVDPTKGLSTDEALARLQKYGPNVLTAKKKAVSGTVKAHLYRLFIPVALLTAALLSLVFSANLSAFVIFLSLSILSVFFDIIESDQARNSAALEKSLTQRVFVRRDGQVVEIDAERVVPGDIVMMTVGTRVPADGRLYTAALLNIDESDLTGVSGTTRKEIAVLEKTQAQLDDRTNMAFKETTVVYGYGSMIVTSTGRNTEMGRITRMSNQTKKEEQLLENQYHPMTFTLAMLAFVSKWLPIVKINRRAKQISVPL
jgi:Ca2+-transporting ATPase